MKISEKVIVNVSITDYVQTNGWSINANKNDKGYYMPSLNKDNLFYADHSKWIIEELFENLKILVKLKKGNDELDSIAIEKAIDFKKNEIPEISKKEYKSILRIIKQAIKLGFFREYYDKSK